MRCIKDTYSRYLCYTFTTSKLSLIHRGGLLKLVFTVQFFFSRICSQMKPLFLQYGSFIFPLWLFESMNWILFERIFLQYGFSNAYPQIAWLSRAPYRSRCKGWLHLLMQFFSRPEIAVVRPLSLFLCVGKSVYCGDESLAIYISW